MNEPRSLRDVPGLRVGHATDRERATGCTVVLATDGAVAGVDVRGSAPGTRETDLLRPTALVERIHAVLLTGGSAFGLAAADGVMRWLDQRGIGLDTGVRKVPLVPAAVLFDLGVGEGAYPGPSEGYAACDAAASEDGSIEGSVGAGTGATVGKLAGPQLATKSGVGTAARLLPGGVVVGALAATNAVGNVVADDGSILGGVRSPGGSGFLGAAEAIGLAAGAMAEAAARAGTSAGPSPQSAEAAPSDTRHAAPGTNTTLAVIGTNASLDRAGCRKLAELGHDALAIAIRPVHTMLDGDTVFALATGTGQPLGPVEFTALGVAAVEALVEAIQRSVLEAESLAGVRAVER